VHALHQNAYPEVSGYLVPSLIAYGERGLARRSLEWLINIQQPDGSFTDPDGGAPYIFDTGQVLRGLNAGIGLVPGAAGAAGRAAHWLVGRMIDGGQGGFPEAYQGLDHVPETVQLYVLSPLREAATLLGEPNWAEAADRCLQYYLGRPDLLDLDRSLTHFLAYEIEALIDLGQADLVGPTLERLERLQRRDGSLRGICGADWVCTPGLLQIAICWYKTGRPEPADRAIGWVERHQLSSGGFLGSYGRRAWYFPKEELSWTAKYYLDANRLRILSFFDRNADFFPSRVAADDGRLARLVAAARPGDAVLEVGCGKGRFIAALAAQVEGLRCKAVDISPVLLGGVAASIATDIGSLECIPSPDDTFDLVFSVEAIEHSANPKAAVEEMVRVAKPGGIIVIIDKQDAHWGRLECVRWECWPELGELASLMQRECSDVMAETVGYDGNPASDGMMVAWSGRKKDKREQDEISVAVV
jgi:malonyl-CoA O-methyltransferase